MKDLTAGQITAWALAEMERKNCFVWRNNNLSVPGRKFIGMKGVPDIVGFVKNKGTAAYCEVKTANDKFSEYQINFLNRPYVLQSQKAIANIDRAKAELLPEWILGYFNQSIRPDFLLQGVYISARVPIWTKYAQSEIQKSQLMQEYFNLESEIQAKKLNLEKDLALQKAILFKNRLDEQGSLLLNQSQLLNDLAKQQMDAGEIDYFRYVQALESSYNSTKEYLLLIQQYNQAIIELEYFIE